MFRHIIWILRTFADASYGMLRVCAVFRPPLFLQTIHWLCLTVLVLVFSLLNLFALIENSELEKIELCATIHAAFNEFQAMHLSLHLTLTPFQRQASFHSIVIFFQSIGEALEFGHALFFHPIEPRIEAFAPSLSQHGGEILDENRGLGNLVISLTQLSQVLLLPFQALIFFKGDPMSHLRSRWGTLGGRLDRSFIGRVNLLEFPPIFLFAKLHKVALNGLVRASVALLFQFTIHELSISASLVPAFDQVILVWLNERFPLLIDTRPFWGLLHFQVIVHRLPTQSHLVSNRGDLGFFGMKLMDLVVPFDPLLMEAHTLGFLALCTACIPGRKLLGL